MKQFVSVNDAGDMTALINSALAYKKDPLGDAALGRGKRVGLLFFNPSLRTRISTQIAATNLGMEAVIFNADKDGWALEFNERAIMNGSTAEHVRDAAPVLGAYFDILCVRSFPALKNREEDYAETVINQFIQHAGVPVVSLETATLHPLQSLADIISIEEDLKEGRIKNAVPKVVLTWAPHVKALPQCVANSFAQWVNAWGKADFVIAHPEGYELNEAFTAGATITHDQQSALKNADFVYVKNWSSFTDYGAMLGNHADWMLTAATMAVTADAKVMHCLPLRRNVELSDEIAESPNSLILTQAKNRVFAAQAVLAGILKRGHHE